MPRLADLSRFVPLAAGLAVVVAVAVAVPLLTARDVRSRVEEVQALRREGKPTIPMVLGMEKAANLFLSTGSEQKFADLRRWKDQF